MIKTLGKIQILIIVGFIIYSFAFGNFIKIIDEHDGINILTGKNTWIVNNKYSKLIKEQMDLILQKEYIKHEIPAMLAVEFGFVIYYPDNHYGIVGDFNQGIRINSDCWMIDIFDPIFDVIREYMYYERGVDLSNNRVSMFFGDEQPYAFCYIDLPNNTEKDLVEYPYATIYCNGLADLNEAIDDSNERKELLNSNGYRVPFIWKRAKFTDTIDNIFGEDRELNKIVIYENFKIKYIGSDNGINWYLIKQIEEYKE